MPLNHMKALVHTTAVLCLSISASMAAPVNEISGSFEWMDADDVTLTQFSLLADSNIGDWDSSVSFAYGTFDLDFEPVSFDFKGYSSERSETNKALQINARKDISESKTLLLGVGAYDGFTNYRSLWLDEYYRQQFSDAFEAAGFENYIEASPGGYSGNFGLRWMYLPSTAYAQITISSIRDTVSPGYEIDFDGLRRGEIELATTSISLSTENVIAKRLRSLLTIRVSETSGRDVRYGAEYALNAAIGEKWILRILGGATSESPDFSAQYGNLSLEYALSETFSLYSDARYYQDTGEIEDAFLFTAAAPGLLSRKVGLGAKWSGENWSTRIYYAPSSSHYEESLLTADFFENLYLDRDWDILQFAFNRSF